MNNPLLKTKLSDINLFIILFLITYSFSILIRLIWVSQFQDNLNFYWNDQLMINTNDGYFFAEGARDILSSVHQNNDLSPITHPLSQLTALLASVLPFSFESIILYMPSFIGSFLVFAVLLIGFSIKEKLTGFIASLSAGIVWSYYNRTMTGYYDTDMLTVVLPTFIVSSMIFAATHQKNRYLLMIPLAIMANQWWYHASAPINLSLFTMMFIYTAIFERQNNYFYKILLFMAIALIGTYFWIKLIVVVGLFSWFHIKHINNLRLILILLFSSIFAIVFTGGMNAVFLQLQAYVFRAETMDATNITLHFYNVAQTVREAGKIPFETFANRISGNPAIFILSLIGYILLIIRHKVVVLTLPLVALGFIAYVGGLRFTVYAVPIMALSMAYLITQIATYIENKPFKYLFLTGATIAILSPNISHIIDYRVPTVFQKNEVKILDQLKERSSREDYVLTWWDYGYPIRYYADVKTLVDGGKHNGDVNFPVSFALTRPQKASARLARLDVEYTELAYEHNRTGSYIQMMMEDYNYDSPNNFLEALQYSDIKLPTQTRDVYYYLPLRMMNIYPTVALFSNMDLTTGKQKRSPFFYQTSQFKEQGGMINLGRGILLNKAKGTIRMNNQDLPLSLFITTAYDRQGKLQVSQQRVKPNANLVAVYMKSYNKFLIMDRNVYNSTYIQLFVLEKYDRTLFEEVIMTPMTKIYRLRI